MKTTLKRSEDANSQAEDTVIRQLVTEKLWN